MASLCPGRASWDGAVLFTSLNPIYPRMNDEPCSAAPTRSSRQWVVRRAAAPHEPGKSLNSHASFRLVWLGDRLQTGTPAETAVLPSCANEVNPCASPATVTISTCLSRPLTQEVPLEAMSIPSQSGQKVPFCC